MTRNVRRFDGRGAVVTGGGSGIGRATVRRLAEEGARVVAVEVDPTAAEAAANELAAEGHDVVGLPAEATNEDEVDRCIPWILEHLGEVDVLVNNVGGARREGGSRWFWDLDLALFRALGDHNLHGTFLWSNRLVHGMMARRRGAIVNVASTAGILTDPGHSHYGAFKAAVIQLTRGMAVDLAPHGVRVNCVAPGEVRTKRSQEVNWERTFELKIPMLRAGRADEIAAVIAFLASDDASYMTGSVVVADGGLTAKE